MGCAQSAVRQYQERGAGKLGRRTSLPFNFADLRRALPVRAAASGCRTREKGRVERAIRYVAIPSLPRAPSATLPIATPRPRNCQTNCTTVAFSVIRLFFLRSTAYVKLRNFARILAATSRHISGCP